MIILVSGATATTRRLGPYRLGALLVPRGGNTAPADRPWALDNDAYSGFDRDRFIAMLKRYQGQAGCLWCAAPDVVGDAWATLARFRLWAPVIRYYGYPVAYVLQDGQDRIEPPWGEIDAVFIGGTTPFKLGPVAASIVRDAKAAGLRVHMGRVNTRRRLLYAGSIGCDSVDGSSFSRFADTHLPWAIQHASVKQERLCT